MVSVSVKSGSPTVSSVQEEVTIGHSVNIRSIDATPTHTSRPPEIKRESERS